MVKPSTPLPHIFIFSLYSTAIFSVLYIIKNVQTSSQIYPSILKIHQWSGHTHYFPPTNHFPTTLQHSARSVHDSSTSNPYPKCLNLRNIPGSTPIRCDFTHRSSLAPSRNHQFQVPSSANIKETSYHYSSLSDPLLIHLIISGHLHTDVSVPY